jgi:hypothetical protein
MLKVYIITYYGTWKSVNLCSKPQIVAQSYDGANVMSGKFNRLQNKIKNQYPYAIYTHCMSHTKEKDKSHIILNILIVLQRQVLNKILITPLKSLKIIFKKMLSFLYLMLS